MSKAFKAILVSTLVVLAASNLIGCGSSNNDQGASLTSLGYFEDSTGSTGFSGAIARINYDRMIFAENEKGNPPTLIAYMGLQNNLSEMFVNIRRIDCRYEIPGADPSVRIPSDSTGVAMHMAATGGEGGESKAYVGFMIVSTNLYQYLNVNQASLPELPFYMQITCSATGVTQAGDVITTNEAYFFVDFYEAPECCTIDPSNSSNSTDQGFHNGVGTGGTYNSYSTVNNTVDGESTITAIDEPVLEEPASEAQVLQQ